MPRSDRPVMLFLPTFDSGGVERMMVNLAQGFARCGRAVDVLVDRSKHDYLESLPVSARLIELVGSDAARRRIVETYLRRERPASAIASKLGAATLLLDARRSASIPLRVVARVGTTVSHAMQRENPWTRWRSFRALRRLMHEADAVVAVSRGVADDITRIAPRGHAPVHVIPNPVITPSLYELAAAPTTHPWFNGAAAPVLLSVGRFSRAKDYPTLLRAFAALPTHHGCRLVILGDGRQRSRLERLVRRLGLSHSVDLPGFVANPYPYIARARVFVLSSLWEGSPNALAEALALGTPVVASDCPSGPRELLQDGKYGRLTPPGDANALSQAIVATLAAAPPPEKLKEAVQDYTAENSACQYLRVLDDQPV